MSTAGAGLYVCGQCKFNNSATLETFFKPAAYVLKGQYNFTYVAAGKNICYGIDKDILYKWDTHGEESIHAVKGLEGLKISKVFSHFELPYACVLTDDGQVYSWGKSDNFLTGLGTEVSVNVPLRMECFDSPVHRLALGSDHGIAVTNRGTVYTWGIGLGIGVESLPFPHTRAISETDFFAMPTKVAGIDTKVVEIAVGENFSVACTEIGEVWTWGVGASGRLGQGDKIDHREPIIVAGLKGKHVVQVAAGERHGVALTREGEVYTWGENSNCELGLEGNPLKYSPAILSNLSNILQIFCANSSNFAITKDGELYVWGQNTWGQLGQGHSRNIPVPTKVALPGDKSNANVSMCAMGFNHSLFLTNATLPIKPKNYTDVGLAYPSPPSEFYKTVDEGQLWCTGAVLGTGNEANDDITIFTPAKNFQARHIVNGATGMRAGYASTADGLLWTWGNATLGNGLSTDPVTNPAKMWDLETARVIQIFASPDDWYMALTADGRLYAWGKSSGFRTGLGSETKLMNPRLVEGFDSAVARFSIGQSHGLAVTADYSVYTWGTGRGLGNGGRQNTEKTPKRVIGMEEHCVCDVAAGNNFSVLLTKSGKMMTWGEGCSGKLGHGNEDSILIPTEVAKLQNSKIVQVACGGEFCLALSDQGQVFSWGSGSDGCLGVGSTYLDNMYEPQCVPYLDKICVISAVDVAVFAISSEGGLYAWGKPHLGVGSGRVMARPIRVASLQKVRVQGVAGGEWQTFVWVSSHDIPPPLPPSRWPWPTSPPTPTLHTSSSVDLQRSPSKPLAIAGGLTKSQSKSGGFRDVLTAIDPERFAEHEDYLKKMPFMYRFFPNDPDIDNFAATGKVGEIIDFLNHGKFWGPTPEQAKSIQHATHATKQDEKVIKSWVVVAINSKNFENERILIVTDKAHYRIKYDPKKEEVIHAKRYPVKTVFQVMAGRFREMSKSVSSHLRGKAYDKQYGFQVWTSNPKEWTPSKAIIPFKKRRPPFYLYRPTSAENGLQMQESICLEVCLALQASIHWYRNGLRHIDYIHEFVADSPKTNDNFPAFPCRKVEFIDRCVDNGLIAYAYNKLK